MILVLRICRSVAMSVFYSGGIEQILKNVLEGLTYTNIIIL
jgi:hypothetical protein